jgi:hypothetical protein
MAKVATEPWQRRDASLLLRVRLTPEGGRDAVEGVAATAEGPALKARVRAAPEDGEANAALLGLVAKWLGLPKRSVSLVSGPKSRTKVLEIMEAPAGLEDRMRAATAQLLSE